MNGIDKFDNPSPACPPPDCCSARQSAESVLRDRANMLRRQAGQLHQEADRVEALANYASGIKGHAEEALWRLAINNSQASAPRLF